MTHTHTPQELIKLASSVGVVDSLRHLLEQPTVQEDEEELEEAVENALKVGKYLCICCVLLHTLSGFGSRDLQSAVQPGNAALMRARLPCISAR
jgi:hypothetical protein